MLPRGLGSARRQRRHAETGRTHAREGTPPAHRPCDRGHRAPRFPARRGRRTVDANLKAHRLVPTPADSRSRRTSAGLERKACSMTGPLNRARIGVVGAGRVGAVLASALRSVGHEIVAVAGESDASRDRIDALLPGVTIAKPSAVARACDVLLLTVPDDMLANVVGVLAASGSLHEGQYVVHTSGRHGLEVLAPAAAAGARPVAMHPA
ncbi:MAG TPA: NAD(P)-binding domain-containing protein, partial [Nocardioides sp.]